MDGSSLAGYLIVAVVLFFILLPIMGILFSWMVINLLIKAFKKWSLHRIKVGSMRSSGKRMR